MSLKKKLGENPIVKTGANLFEAICRTAKIDIGKVFGMAFYSLLPDLKEFGGNDDYIEFNKNNKKSKKEITKK